MKTIFDLCEEYHIRSKSIERHPDRDIPLYACVKKYECPYQLKDREVKVKMYSSSTGNTVEKFPCCSYMIENGYRRTVAELN